MNRCKTRCLWGIELIFPDKTSLAPTFIATVFLVLTPFITYASSTSLETTTYNLSEIAHGIYLHEGVHVTFEHEQHDDIANIGFILGKKCIAVIDTGGSVSIGNSLLKAIQKVSDKPVCYVINTHVHFDHVLGNLPFLDEHPEFVGHENLKAAIERNRSFFLEEYSNDLGLDPSEDSIIGPDTGVENTKELDLGGRKLLLTAYPTAHSHNDLTVLDQQTGTLWTGDLLFRERIPSLTGNLKGWLDVMESFKTLNVSLVVPGHGTTAQNLAEAKTDQQRYLDNLLKETRQAIADGLFLDEALERVGNDEKARWLLHEQHHKANVIKAFTELEWE
jgi:quinoprotein relay system zinc metallohydrolase 2